MQHLHRNGQMKADALPLFAVTLRFANPNANFTVTLPARNKANALWVAAEWRDRQPEGIRDGQIGEIRRAAP
jgi:hypothetical protein